MLGVGAATGDNVPIVPEKEAESTRPIFSVNRETEDFIKED
jgi:hypothetical protein